VHDLLFAEQGKEQLLWIQTQISHQ